jgi:hypothetical protein
LGRLVLALSLALIGGCGQAQTTPTLQASAGPGWTLLRKVPRVEGPLGIAYERAGADAYEIQLNIFDVGGGGCGAPTFGGFRTEGTTFVAIVERSPMGDICLVTTQVRFDVLVNRAIVPASIRKLEMSEECETSGCSGHGVPFP